MWFKSMGSGMSELITFYHAAGRIIDGKEDPECAGKVSGKINFRAPKLSGEKFRSTFLQYLESANTFYPKMLPYVSFNQPDGWSTIDDEDIANGWDKLKERGDDGRYSDYAWDFNTNMLDRYNKKYPGNKQRKAFYAYSGTVGVPTQLKGKFIPDDMTCVFANTTAYDHLNPEFTSLMKEWFKCVKEPEQFIYYDYLYDRGPHRNYPPTPYIFTENLKQLFKNVTPDKCQGFLLEYDGPFGDVTKAENRNTNIGGPAQTHLMMYLYSKLMWDPKVDVDKLLAEYYTLYYDPAAEEMKALDKFGEEIWMRKAPRRVTASSGNFKEEDVTKLFVIFGKARAKVEAGSIHAKRLDRLANEMEPRFGGPNFIVLPDSSLIAAGRSYRQPFSTVIASMDREHYDIALTLPSGGSDTGYPGMVWHNDELWVSYYSNHEVKDGNPPPNRHVELPTAIYLARIRFQK